MALTETRHAAEFLMSEGNGKISREVITVLSGAGVLAAGTVVGALTSGGKFVPSANAEVVGEEGAETATAVTLYPCDATSADAKVVAIVRYAEVNGDLLTYDSTVDDASKKATKAAQLALKGIIVR